MQQNRILYPRRNNQINSPTVRLIDSDGTMLGIKPLAEALSLARSRSTDLVEIAPQGKPSVCKLLDFAKYCYELEKKQREARKKQKAGILKEIRFKSRIGPHDLDVKIRHAEEFLKKHDKVRFTVIFHGRENQHKDIGAGLLSQVVERLAPVSTAEGNVQNTGNRMSVMLVPKH